MKDAIAKKKVPAEIGLAGDIARETMGEHSLVATDLLTALPEAFRSARQAAKDHVVRIPG